MRNLKELSVLEIKNTKVKEIPSWINECSSLEQINLASGSITKLPKEIGECQGLEVLCIEES